jgi:hypothetical protein
MVEPIGGHPRGVLGFRLTGKLERDGYHDLLMAPVNAALERGERQRVLVELSDDSHGLDAGALWEGLEVAGPVGLEPRPAWERFAVVTDKDGVGDGVAVVSWASPGGLEVFADGEREQAAAWPAE